MKIILRANFPYLESPSKLKLRPVLQLTEFNERYKIAVVAYMTSRVEKLLNTDVLIEEYKDCGLEKRTVVRLHKLYSIPASKVTGEIGVLPGRYDTEIKLKLVKLFGL